MAQDNLDRRELLYKLELLIHFPYRNIPSATVLVALHETLACLDMDVTAYNDAINFYKALWPHIVEKIGAAVDGSQEKVKQLQETSFAPLQLPHETNDTAAYTMSNTSHNAEDKPAISKRRRNRYPCYLCKTNRQKVR